ncbi:MAG: MOSC domain-containing protein [Pseudomonadota bacterium]
MSEVRHLDASELLAGLDHIRRSPADKGVVHMIVRRPETEQREVCESGRLDEAEGLLGDNWSARGSSRMPDGSAHPEMQLNIMNSRVVDLVAVTRDRWPLAGDQIYIDMDLSKDNLPAGTRLALGSAIVEVTAEPHAGCKKFVARFGLEAMKFVNSGLGKTLCLRGINAKVVRSGEFRVGDIAQRLSRSESDAGA